MDLILSKYFGPCYGVSRAFNEAIKSDSKVKILGNIAHNQLLIDKLKQNKNIEIVQDISEINENDKVIIRTHGLPLEQLGKLRQKKCKIIDQTCSNVKLVQKIAEKAEKERKTLILTGNSGHPEVIGISSRCKSTFIISNTGDLKDLLTNSNLDLSNCIIASQTTFNSDKFENICNFLKIYYPEIKIYNTICGDSLKRKNEIIKISNFVDLCVVIGDKNSSNSVALFDFSKKFCESVFAENVVSFDFNILNKKNRIFITSGASVLKETVMLFVNKISNLFKYNNVRIKCIV